MRIRNRIKLMIAVENRYFNRKGAISVLIGVTAALLVFNLVFNIFYCFGALQTEGNLAFFRNSVYLLASYILLFIAYRVIMRYTGIRYALIMIFTGLSFSAAAAAGYMLARAAFCWSLNRLIENPLGFEPLLRRAYAEALRNLVYIAAFYLAVSLIPAIRHRPAVMGRFWAINLFMPLTILGFLVAVIVFAPEETRVEYARLSSIAYLTGMFWYSFRYLLKTLYYFILLPSERRLKLDEIPRRRFFFGRKRIPQAEEVLSEPSQTDKPTPVDVRILKPPEQTLPDRTPDGRPGIRTLPALSAAAELTASSQSDSPKTRGLYTHAFEITEIKEPDALPSSAKAKAPAKETARRSSLPGVSFTVERIE